MIENNSKELKYLISLIEEIKSNFSSYVAYGNLNSEGKKIKMQLIKKAVEVTNSKELLKYIKKNKEEDMIKLIKILETKLENFSF